MGHRWLTFWVPLWACAASEQLETKLVAAALIIRRSLWCLFKRLTPSTFCCWAAHRRATVSEKRINPLLFQFWGEEGGSTLSASYPEHLWGGGVCELVSFREDGGGGWAVGEGRSVSYWRHVWSAPHAPRFKGAHELRPGAGWTVWNGAAHQTRAPLTCAANNAVTGSVIRRRQREVVKLRHLAFLAEGRIGLERQWQSVLLPGYKINTLKQVK